MFSYYGSKSKIVNLYPAPRYGKIIEPFAGSARYSLKYWDRDILLVDKYEIIVKVWKWLQQCSPKDILGLPEMKDRQSVDDLNICQEAKWLIGFCINQGSAVPKKMYRVSERHNFTRWDKDKTRIANSLFRIRHWNIVQDDYANITNQECTWFIDPPYQCGGKWYKNNDIDYHELAQWCMSRHGQIIVCENTMSNWMPFVPLKRMHGAYSETTEAIWMNDIEQLSML